MSDEGGGLASFTDTVYARSEKLNENDWRHAFDERDRESHNFTIAQAVPSFGPTTTEQLFPQLRAFQEQFPRARLSYLPVLDLTLNVAPNLQRFVLGSSTLLKKVLGDVMSDLPYDPDKYANTSLDMRSPRGVTLDNVQTILDVVSLVSRSAHTPQEYMALFERLLQVCPNDEVTIGDDKVYKVNPHGYTYLELFALAPFSFWADVRTRPPETYLGRTIIRPHDTERPIDPMFIYFVTREIPPTKSNRHSRHGGCPALYPEYRQHDLINREGRLLIRAQQEFLKFDTARTETRES
ncbi:MAG: hypothetical protein G01um10148_900 [Parcubacteria group bacterium Gr01-1014_8]|nr:MAG: hypothetical protein G01um10148_900 [Parcubacteria group bacterium Gr01-1014_8]